MSSNPRGGEGEGGQRDKRCFVASSGRARREREAFGDDDCRINIHVVKTSGDTLYRLLRLTKIGPCRFGRPYFLLAAAIFLSPVPDVDVARAMK